MNKPEHILVIEDDPIFCDTLVTFLTKEGFEVMGVQDGQHALELAKSKFFHLIISDVRLPGGMDGIEVLTQLRYLSSVPNKMIVMTGYADKEASVKAIKLGVDDYIYKPFSRGAEIHR